MAKTRAPRNRTLTCTQEEVRELSTKILPMTSPKISTELYDSIICQDFFDVAHWLPEAFVDLCVLDPPYNLSKDYHGHAFRETGKKEYEKWFSAILRSIKPKLKSTATIYVCSDWKTSTIIAPLLEENFIVKNRITWEREKGRGAKMNWKNNIEDIWYCVMSQETTFNVDSVKLKRKVIAPYRKENGEPKDWSEGNNGKYRLTHPSNIWTDITIPFWSMPENTDHPTQKPEKLIAKLILASSNPGDIVLDPFLGSGTTAVVAKKLQRKFVGIEINQEYCCWALKRLAMAEVDSSIQGYSDNVFWERNTLNEQPGRSNSNVVQKELFV